MLAVHQEESLLEPQEDPLVCTLKTPVWEEEASSTTEVPKYPPNLQEEDMNKTMDHMDLHELPDHKYLVARKKDFGVYRLMCKYLNHTNSKNNTFI